MKPLIDAILRHDASQVASLVGSSRALLTQRSEAGFLPADLALAAGYHSIATLLLIEGAPTTRAVDWGELLRATLYDVSAQWFLAGWVEGLEFLLWRYLSTGESFVVDKELFHEPPAELREHLRFLADQSESWFIATGGGLQAVNMSSWLSRFADWERQHA